MLRTDHREAGWTKILRSHKHGTTSAAEIATLSRLTSSWMTWLVMTRFAGHSQNMWKSVLAAWPHLGHTFEKDRLMPWIRWAGHILTAIIDSSEHLNSQKSLYSQKIYINVGIKVSWYTIKTNTTEINLITSKHCVSYQHSHHFCIIKGTCHCV